MESADRPGYRMREKGETVMIKKLLSGVGIPGRLRARFRRRHHRPSRAIGLTPDQIQWKKGEANDTRLAHRRSDQAGRVRGADQMASQPFQPSALSQPMLAMRW